MSAMSYSNMPMEDYLALKAVNATLIKCILDRCPAAAWHESWLNANRFRETSQPMDAGSVAHAILLEGNSDCCVVIDPEDHPAEKTGNIPDGWTNKSIKLARDQARADGKIPILKPAMGEISAMVNSGKRYIESLKKTEPAVYAAFQPGGGESEMTIIWNDGPTPCKIRPDRISTDRKLVIDSKFTGTNAEPDTWGRMQMVRMQYYVGAAFYRRGIEAAFKTQCDYLYLVIEDTAPYLCSLVGVDPHGFDLGSAKCNAGLDKWQQCVDKQFWPSYPTRIVYPEIPAWEDTRWEEKEAIDYGSQA